MPQERNALKVGIVTIVVIVLAFAVLIWISQEVGGEMQPVTIHFRPSAAMPTIVPGSAVLVGGQKVGHVVEARLEIPKQSDDEQAAPPYVLVEAEIFAGLVLRADCSAFAEGPPLGGDGLIKIDLGSSRDLFEQDHIEGAQPGGFAAILASLQSEFDGDDPNSLLGQVKAQLDPEAELSLLGKLHRSLADINAMTASLAKELGPAEKATLMAKIHLIADNVNETTQQLRREFDAGQPDVLLRKIHLAMDAVNQGIEAMTRIVRTGERPITNTLHNIEKTTEHIASEMDPSRADSLMAHLKATSERINTAVEDINTVTSTTRELVVLNRENINRMLVNFKEASDHVKTGIKFVLRHPWRLLNEPSTREMKQQAIFDAARSFSEAAARIDDASAHLRALSDLHNGRIPIDDPNLARIRTDLEQTRSQYRKAEAALWQQLGIK